LQLFIVALPAVCRNPLIKRLTKSMMTVVIFADLLMAGAVADSGPLHDFFEWFR
jgi:hypothetical protein